MKSRGQRTETRSQESGVRGPTLRPSTACRRAGFTLIELLLAAIISLMVFAAMGRLLTRCFALWMDSSANWRLSQYARISRERILHGAFADPSGGLLSASNVSIVGNSAALNVAYAAGTNFYGVCGYTNIVQPRMYLLDQKTMAPYWDPAPAGYDDWRYGVRNDKNTPIPDVELSSMTAAFTNDILTLTYTLQFSAAGRMFTQPQTIRAFLINND